ncbi:hypothetical protein M5K25_012084 [Dendrobium thyrsiflorum]|uniref:Uncharacterized protein n=1 Tax=Dendrobium thyrsiflorum TaxID=117978 RepID=A0ABD0UVZ4_DENTH
MYHKDEISLIWYAGKDEKQLVLKSVSKIIPGQRTLFAYVTFLPFLLDMSVLSSRESIFKGQRELIDDPVYVLVGGPIVAERDVEERGVKDVDPSLLVVEESVVTRRISHAKPVVVMKEDGEEGRWLRQGKEEEGGGARVWERGRGGFGRELGKRVGGAAKGNGGGGRDLEEEGGPSAKGKLEGGRERMGARRGKGRNESSKVGINLSSLILRRSMNAKPQEERDERGRGGLGWGGSRRQGAAAGLGLALAGQSWLGGGPWAGRRFGQPKGAAGGGVGRPGRRSMNAKPQEERDERGRGGLGWGGSRRQGAAAGLGLALAGRSWLGGGPWAGRRFGQPKGAAGGGVGRPGRVCCEFLAASRIFGRVDLSLE